MNWTPLNLTVRVGCHLAYETSVPTAALFVLKPRLEGRVLVMQEKLSFGIGLPSYEFQDSHGNITYRSTLMPGRNEIRHDALVAVSSLPDSREVLGRIWPSTSRLSGREETATSASCRISLRPGMSVERYVMLPWLSWNSYDGNPIPNESFSCST